MRAGTIRNVFCEYKLEGNEVTFALGRYDESEPLVIDPVYTFSGTIGGSNEDRGNGIAVAPGGDVYITGMTQSADMSFMVSPSGQDQNKQMQVFVGRLTGGGGRSRGRPR